MTRDRRALLTAAHDLADLADAITEPLYRAGLGEGPQGLSVDLKADGTPVTEADLDAERAIRRAIGSRFPDHAVLGEEDGLDGAVDAPTWIVDPIDGTKNFVLGIPVWATLIALVVDGIGQVAVISAPALGTRWDGIAGGAARRDGREIHVSDTDDLSRAHVSFGGLGYFDRRLGLDAVNRLAVATARQRGFGDFWQHCLVASGAVDVAVEAEVSRWDLAAPKIIVEAAGGRLTDLEGVDTDDGGSAVTTNGILHEAVLSTLGAAG